MLVSRSHADTPWAKTELKSVRRRAVWFQAGWAQHAFTATGSMGIGRYQHQAVMLNSGVVLITGGYDWTGTPIYSTELYHP